ncbi:MAG: PA14 domain-containing protein [Verrucomicrobiota bacterium]
MRLTISILLLTFIGADLLAAAPKSKSVRIKMQRGLMRYRVESFFVRPGENVRLILDNNDEIQHNLVLCAKGADNWKPVAAAALTIGESAFERGFVPESPLVLHATKLVDPHDIDEIEFTAPMEEGIYPYVCTFPGHAQLMRGEMVVASSLPRMTDLRYDYFEGEWESLDDFAKAKPVASGKMEGNRIGLEPREQDDHFGFIFTAQLQAPVDGDYQFHLASDDGSQILVNGKPVLTIEGARAGGTMAKESVALKAGSHELTVRYFEKKGGEELRVAWTGPGFKESALTDPRFIDANVRLADMILVPSGEIMVVRCNLPDAPARSIAVGTPLGIHYCFDAVSCRVLYLWGGEFLDIGPERGDGKGRGGQVCKVLGEPLRINAGDAFPLAFTDPAMRNATPKFLGYRRAARSTIFVYDIGGVKVEQSVTVSLGERAALGMTYKFDGKVQGPVNVAFDEEAVEVAAISFGGGGHGAEGGLTWTDVSAGISLILYPHTQ